MAAAVTPPVAEAETISDSAHIFHFSAAEIIPSALFMHFAEFRGDCMRHCFQGKIDTVKLQKAERTEGG